MSICAAKWLLPIHNGTFDLSMHPWAEPFERVLALGDARGVNIATPIMGDASTSMRRMPANADRRPVLAAEPAAN